MLHPYFAWEGVYLSLMTVLSPLHVRVRNFNCQPFTVHWRDHGTRQTTCSFITLDGENVPGRYLFGEGVASRKGIRCPETEDKERPFMFSEYNTLSSMAFTDIFYNFCLVVTQEKVENVPVAPLN